MAQAGCVCSTHGNFLINLYMLHGNKNIKNVEKMKGLHAKKYANKVGMI